MAANNAEREMVESVRDIIGFLLGQ